MRTYTGPYEGLLTVITYGSHLYGTVTAKSDTDFKAIALPPKRDLFLGKPLRVDRKRHNPDGSPMGPNDTMQPDGWEIEISSVQKFVADFFGGQSWAIETAFAVAQRKYLPHAPQTIRRFEAFRRLCVELLSPRFLHRNVQGMVGFAVKQTFDYVRRGERLLAARHTLYQIDAMLHVLPPSARLDDDWSEDQKVLDQLAKSCEFEIGARTNHRKIFRTLKLNGREYLETTKLSHFRDSVQALVNQYGERSTNAGENTVDWKSMHHAVRVYQQVQEYLTTGWIEFPRPNIKDLLEIKQGRAPWEEVKEMLIYLDNRVQDLIAGSELPIVNDEMKVRAENMLYTWLNMEYAIDAEEQYATHT